MFLITHFYIWYIGSAIISPLYDNVLFQNFILRYLFNKVTIGYNLITRHGLICKAVFLTFKSKKTEVR